MGSAYFSLGNEFVFVVKLLFADVTDWKKARRKGIRRGEDTEMSDKPATPKDLSISPR
jgi:hypothetical protein